MFDFVHSIECTKKVLSVSGGGLLGVIPAAMLMRYEKLGQKAYGQHYLLSDSFDAVAGSSTGAVIATGVALGLRAEDIVNFYLVDVPVGFKRRRMSIPLIHDVFDGDLMEGFFERRTQGRLLERQELQCDLTILTKDMSRGVSVAFTTLPGMCQQILGAEIRREAKPLSKLLRASTAAPGLFSPVELDLDGVGTVPLADGGFSLFNDPSYLIGRLIQGCGATGIEMTVLGTGSSRPTYSAARAGRGPAIGRIGRSLFGLIKDGEALAQGLMSDLTNVPGSNITCQRHDMPLTSETFAQLGVPVSRKELRSMRAFADIRFKEQLFEAALRLAENTIHSPLPLAGVKQMPQAIDMPEAISANYK